MQTEDSDVLLTYDEKKRESDRANARFANIRKLTSALLSLDKPGSAVNAHNEAASDLGVQGAAMTSFLHAQNTPQPGDNLMRRRVGRFVKVDNTRPMRQLMREQTDGEGAYLM